MSGQQDWRTQDPEGYKKYMEGPRMVCLRKGGAERTSQQGPYINRYIGTHCI